MVKRPLSRAQRKTDDQLLRLQDQPGTLADALREVGQSHYLFNSDVQLTTTVSGSGDTSPTGMLIRKRWPSPATL